MNLNFFYCNFLIFKIKINWTGFLLNNNKFRDHFLFVKHFILLRDLLIRKWSKSFFGLDAQPSIQIYWAILKHFNRTEYHLYYLCCENDITAANLFLYLTFSLLLPCTYSQNKGCYISWVTSGTEQKGKQWVERLYDR